MRRLTPGIVLAAVFAVGIVAGFSSRPAEAGKCYTTDCNGGEALYCCRTNGKLLCRVIICG